MTEVATAPAPSPKPKSRFGGTQEKCAICVKTVYPMEKITAEGKVWHKTCLKCTKCNKILTLGTYVMGGDKTYCKPHFTELFKLKGNYEEGFGETKHTGKWGGDKKEKV